MISTDYLKDFMRYHKITQVDLAAEWGKIANRKRWQTSVNNELSKDVCDSLAMIQALANLAKVPVNDIINMVSMDKKRSSVIYAAPDISDNVMIPVTNLRGAANSLMGYMNEPGQADEFMSVPSYFIKSGTNLLIRVTGESMMPTFKSDDYIVCRLLNEFDWTNIKDEHVYLILTKEGETLLKRVKNRLSEYKLIVCKSDNPDKVNYPDRNVEFEEIDQVWSVHISMSWKFPDPHAGFQEQLNNINDRVMEHDYKLEQIYKEMKTLRALN